MTKFAIAAFAAIAFACSEDPTPDAGGADGSDASDAGDADVSGSEDVGPADVGECGCTFGFHQSCAADEVCVGAYNAAPMCTRTEPSNSCVRTSTPGVSAPCNAQCATSSYDISPCKDASSSPMQNTIRDWFTAIENARMTSQPTGWERMRQEDIDAARRSVTLSAECIDFLGWTVLGLVELCRGSDTVRHFEPWHAVENISFKFLSSPTDDCKINAGQACALALEMGVVGGEDGVVFIDQIPASCAQAGLPYAAPCNDAGAQDCLRTRVATIIRTLHRP